MNIVILTLEEAGISYSQIIELMHESFQERLNQGLHYSCSTMDVEQYKEKTKNGKIFVAIDDISGNLAGTTTLNLVDDLSGRHGYMEFVAISSNYKHCGIGSMLVDRMRKFGFQEGCDFILSDTSTQAISALKFHLKNGFKIIGLESYRSTNYWSYVFRMQLTPSFLWNSSTFLKMHYWFSYIFIKTTRDINGNDTTMGIIYKKIRGLCKS